MGRQLLLSLLLASLGTLLHVNVRWADARPANVEATSFSEGADSTGPVLAEEPNLELQDEADVENYPRHLQLQHNAAASEQPLASKLTALTRQVISKRPANPEGDTLTKSVDDFTKDLLEKTGNRTMRVCGNKIHALMKSVCQLVGKFVAVLKNADEVKFILRKLKGKPLELNTFRYRIK